MVHRELGFWLVEEFVTQLVFANTLHMPGTVPSTGIDGR